MTFAYPNYLWFLLVIPPAMLLFFWWAARTRQRLMVQFIQARLLPGLVAGASATRQRIRAALLTGGVICLLLALARPQWGYTLQEAKVRGLDIVVAVDTSKSMLAADIAPNRLARAKLAALDLMQQAKADRLGLVAFAGSAFLVCPLTIDDVAFRQSLEALDVNTLPNGGTALAEAIDTSFKAFKEEDNYKVLVLFTDGEDHDSGALQAAERVAQSGMRIYTIGVGTAEGELLRIRRPDGQSDFVRDVQGNVVKSHLNEKLLRDIAEATTGGHYLPLRGANTMDVLYQNHLALLPKSESNEKWVREPRDRYHWPLALALLLLAIEIFVPERTTETRKVLRSVAAPTVAAALLVLLFAPPAASGSPAGALREYQAGHYQQSLTEYERLIAREMEPGKLSSITEEVRKKIEAGDGPGAEAAYKRMLEKAGAAVGRLNFNAGAAAYKKNDLEKAELHFLAATADPDWHLQEQAHYNLGNTRFKQGEQAQQPQDKKSHWEKALENYTAALGLDPKDADAAHNKEFVEAKLKELQQQQPQQKNQSPPPPPSEAAKKAKAEADEAVRQRAYARALEIMNRQLKADPTTASYSDYIQRLSEVNGVQTTPHP